MNIIVVVAATLINSPHFEFLQLLRCTLARLRAPSTLPLKPSNSTGGGLWKEDRGSLNSRNNRKRNGWPPTGGRRILLLFYFSQPMKGIYSTPSTLPLRSWRWVCRHGQMEEWIRWPDCTRKMSLPLVHFAFEVNVRHRPTSTCPCPPSSINFQTFFKK